MDGDENVFDSNDLTMDNDEDYDMKKMMAELVIRV